MWLAGDDHAVGHVAQRIEVERAVSRLREPDFVGQAKPAHVGVVLDVGVEGHLLLVFVPLGVEPLESLHQHVRAWREVEVTKHCGVLLLVRPQVANPWHPRAHEIGDALRQVVRIDEADGKRVGEPVRHRTEGIERARERQGAIVRGLQRPRHVHVHVQVPVLEDEFGSREANRLFDRVDMSLVDAGSLGLDSDDDRHRGLASVLTQARERCSRRVRHFAVVAVPDVPRVEVVRVILGLDSSSACGRPRRTETLRSVHTRPAPGQALIACVITASRTSPIPDATRKSFGRDDGLGMNARS